MRIVYVFCLPSRTDWAGWQVAQSSSTAKNKATALIFELFEALYPKRFLFLSFFDVEGGVEYRVGFQERGVLVYMHAKVLKRPRIWDILRICHSSGSIFSHGIWGNDGLVTSWNQIWDLVWRQKLFDITWFHSPLLLQSMHSPRHHYFTFLIPFTT